MLTLTESEYRKIPADYRSVWTTERTDWDGWDIIRDRYMGKRTLMTNDKGGTCLLVEGSGLNIVADTAFYVRVAFYDDYADVEEYGTKEEAIEAYINSIDAARDGALGDVATITYGEYIHGKMSSIARKDFS